ncbi:hypothetical protein E2C01_004686 [Portunus trituberculatus]|uniref:Uncharacterized protein n=1 Tax=Portunus trituberculatus TaxID=210409 RepID=A0A5B7CR70_PORTR|nr:hypothetical protein [Portunus trituberculatus]
MALRTSPALLALLASYALLACPSLALLPILHDSNIVDENNLAEGMPQPLSLSNAVHLFQRLQQERQNGDMEDIMDQHGDPRLIGITDGGLYRGGRLTGPTRLACGRAGVEISRVGGPAADAAAVSLATALLFNSHLTSPIPPEANRWGLSAVPFSGISAPCCCTDAATRALAPHHVPLSPSLAERE